MSEGSAPQVAASQLNRKTCHFISYQAENYLAMGRFTEAEALLKKAGKLAERLPDSDARISHMIRQAVFTMAKGDRRQAYAELDSVIRLAQAANSPDMEWRARYLAGNALRREARPAGAQAAYQRAIGIIEYLDSRLPQADLKLPFLASRYDPYIALVTLLAHELGNPEAAFHYSEKARARMLSYETLAKAAESSAGPRNLLSDEFKRLESVQAALPQNMTLIDYFMSDDKTLVFIIGAHFFECVTLSSGRSEIGALVESYRGHLRNERQAEARSAGQELYKCLIRPLRAHIRPGHTLCFIPDGSLFLVPFSALITESGRFLVEEFPMAQAPSATVLKWCLGLSRGRADGKARAALVVATEEYLPDVLKEAKAISDSYKPRATYMVRPDLRELAAQVAHFDILHFAGHAEPSRHGSYAYKSGPIVRSSRAGDPEPPFVGSSALCPRLLHSESIMDWKLSRVRLVTLSACGTGLGRYWRGEGLVGLPHAFLSAGAPAVLASLWNVEDTPTRLLMERFYYHLQKDGMSKAEALRQAQMDSMHAPGNDRHPAAWASFILIGDPR
ncbi:MAG: CHAT domain-containing protein [Acidobacteria bacterium]|nr:CHAT domain-containing protein [Acidobacteriota bacterium]MBI3657658.1 CHAT domain-containing protein [Acidobacteriota bacterium]